MKALLDTNVVSEFRKVAPNRHVIEAVRQIGTENTHISSVSIGELTYGIKRLEEGRKRRELGSWLLEIERTYADQILAFDIETAHIWGELVAKTKAAGRTLPIPDAQIAATALQHGLHLVTRNIADFEAAGVMLINPWEDGP